MHKRRYVSVCPIFQRCTVPPLYHIQFCVKQTFSISSTLSASFVTTTMDCKDLMTPLTLSKPPLSHYPSLTLLKTTNYQQFRSVQYAKSLFIPK